MGRLALLSDEKTLNSILSRGKKIDVILLICKKNMDPLKQGNEIVGRLSLRSFQGKIDGNLLSLLNSDVLVIYCSCNGATERELSG